MKSVSLWSDDTPLGENGNVLRLTQRDDLDIYISISARAEGDKSVSIRASGSRHKNYAKIIKKFSEIIDLIEEDIRWKNMRWSNEQNTKDGRNRTYHERKFGEVKR